MFIATGAQYRQSLVGRQVEIYAGGERLEDVTRHPLTQPGVNAVALLYDLAQDPELASLMTARSPLTGAPVHRYGHIPQSADDLLKKIQAARRAAEVSPISGLASWGVDLLSALSIVTHEMQQALGTPYYDRFLRYLRRYQAGNLWSAVGVTDVKGDRRLRPAEQEDPDLYLHVVRQTADGIVVRGAKAHTTGAPVAHELLVIPTRALRASDRDYAVAFAVAADTPGVKLICRAASPAREDSLDAPMSGRFSLVETLTIFEDVFVPWERVFMCGEWPYAGRLVELFATYHRHTYAGAKAAMFDLLIGAAGLAAEYNGVAEARHIQDKLADLMQAAALIYAAGVAAALHCTIAGPGTAVPDAVLTNAGKHLSGVKFYDALRAVHDIAGGLVVTMPAEADFRHPSTRPYLEKYLKGAKGIPTLDRVKLFKFIRDLTASDLGGMWMVESLHGGGSLEAERIAVRAHYPLDHAKALVRALARLGAARSAVDRAGDLC
jgi:4-hydroxyphenylacetate 3-monooxygenase/4-hydroxybutyryl-CoA dehydratase/vinylacetyl-CoA-Delta-isomerase